MQILHRCLEKGKVRKDKEARVTDWDWSLVVLAGVRH